MSTKQKNKNIILFGMKHVGKSTVGELLADKLNKKLVKIDALIEASYLDKNGENLTFREIHKKEGADYFRNLETQVLKEILHNNLRNVVIDCGGGTPLLEGNQEILKQIGICVWLKLDEKINYERIMTNGIPAFFKYQEDPKRSFDELVKVRFGIYERLADVVVEIDDEVPDEVLNLIVNKTT